MRKAITTLMQEFERIVEASRIRLAFVRNRPELGNVVAEQFRVYRCLPCSHPVDVTAQRVDFTVMRNHAIWMRQTPRGEGVGREALVNQCHSAFKARIFQIVIIAADLIGQEHALIDNRARRHGNDIETFIVAIVFLIDAVGNDLAQHEQATLKIIIGFNRWAASDENLNVEWLGRGNIGCL